jgi:NADH-quinone oxidoreductase subunit N
VVLLRLVFSVFYPLLSAWLLLFLFITPLTLLYGNLGAIPQTDIKRLLGYSSIGQAGYLLLGLTAGNVLGGAAMIYYLFAYLFSNLLAFLVVAILSVRTGSFRIQDMSGMSKRSPILAGSMLVALLSLAGVPPLGGFFGKFLLIGSVLQAGITWLAVVSVINVAMALYYYLLVVKMMYIRPASDDSAIAVGRPMKTLLYAVMAAVVLLGVFQEPLLEASRDVAIELLSGTEPLSGI